jgi:hypothetical protein
MLKRLKEEGVNVEEGNGGWLEEDINVKEGKGAWEKRV